MLSVVEEVIKTAYTTPTTRSTSDLITAAIWNADIVNNWKASPNELAAAAGDTFYATAAETLARLAIGTAGQIPRVNSGATALEYKSQILDRDISQPQVINVGVQTTLYTYTIPANLMGTNGGIKLQLWGEYLSITNSAQWSIIITLNGTTIAGRTFGFQGINANPTLWYIEAIIFNINNAAIQRSFCAARRGNQIQSAETILIQPISEYWTAHTVDTTEDSTGPLDLDVDVNHFAAFADTGFTADLVLVTYIPDLPA